ncbi:MAG: hypothetical protein QNK05_07245 [Myxococcota bacterium]|nr:hypothetical protein [Myxococcota bacterium]
MRGLAVFLWVSALAFPADAAAPVRDVHDLRWFVHVDLIDAGAGEDLAFWQGVIDQTMAEATDLYEGGHGPFDAPCCTSIERSAAVTTFGMPGDGLDVLDSAADYAAIAAIGLPGSRAFLVDSLTYCGGPAPTSIGCAQTPFCDGNPNDDPDLYLVVTLDSRDGGTLAATLAHERGHNACLVHVDGDECQVMRAAAGGHCVDATECSNLMAGRTTTGGSCTCHDMASGLEPDGTACTGVAGGVCSGGVCGVASGDAAVSLLAAAGPESADGATPDDALALSGLTGGWSDLGPLSGGGDVIEGLAYAHDAGVLYGVVPGPGDDQVVTVDRVSGDITATVGTIANGSERLVALAYDPGATSATSDDRLLALSTDGTFEDLVEIDPASPSTAVFIGSLAFGAADGFRGLAYDSVSGRLFTASPFADGIYEIDTSTCPFFCGLTQQTGFDLSRFDASLSYSPDTGRLYLVGTQIGLAPLGDRLLYDVVDPAQGAVVETRGLDAFTPAALAALGPLAECADGIDNDGDGDIDFAGGDPGCDDASDLSETSPLLMCDDGADNDGDGFTDQVDPGCLNGNFPREDPQCQDGINNDSDLRIDFDGGESIHGVCSGGTCPPGVSDVDMDGIADPDPQCVGKPFKNNERCGLGFEVALVLPLIVWVRGRRRG